MAEIKTITKLMSDDEPVLIVSNDEKTHAIYHNEERGYHFDDNHFRITGKLYEGCVIFTFKMAMAFIKQSQLPFDIIIVPVALLPEFSKSVTN